MTPAKLSTMLELSHRVALEPGTDGEKKEEGGRVTIGLAWRQYSWPRRSEGEGESEWREKKEMYSVH